MPLFSLRPLDPKRAGPFAQYCLPQALQEANRDGGEMTFLGAVWDQSACGAAAVRWDRDRGVLISLFVDPLVRGRGVAGALLDQLLEEAAHRSVPLLLASYVLREASLTAMDALFLRRGAKVVPLAPIFEMDSRRYHDSRFLAPAFRPAFQPDPHIQPFSAFSSEQLEELERRTEIPPFLLPSAYRKRLEPRLSLAWVDEGRVLAYILGGESGPAAYNLLSVWREAGAPASCFLRLLTAQLNLCYYRCGGDFLYTLSAVTPEALYLAERLTGGDYTLYEEHFAQLETAHTPPLQEGGEHASPLLDNGPSQV